MFYAYNFGALVLEYVNHYTCRWQSKVIEVISASLGPRNTQSRKAAYLRALENGKRLRGSSIARRGGFSRPLVDVVELHQDRHPRVEPK